MSNIEIGLCFTVFLLICALGWQAHVMREICLWIANEEEKRSA